MAKESCISSQNGAEHSMSPVDRLVKELSLELRGLLRKVLNVPENDMHALYDLRQLHGEGVYELDRQIRELITQYQCHPEAMKEALLIRLNFLDASSEAPSSINAPGTGRPTADSTGEWSIPPSSESISALSNLEFVKGEATDGKKRQMLATALSMKDMRF